MDEFDLFSELNILRKIIRVKNDKLVDILNYIKNNKFFSKDIYSLYNNVNNSNVPKGVSQT